MKDLKRKSIYVLLIVIAIMGLSACGKDPSDDLQSKKWNVVATNGESYTAEFAKNTVSFKIGAFTRGFTYKINKDEISLEEDGKDPIVFEVEKDGDEYKFKATTSAIKKKFGDLTLSPSK
ncbi:hypothetical protein CN324_13735 [Bacillus anthracis]|uniref:Lipoprotein n=2 Tax=Bacillus cereus group TaxID=86661 RepID=A0A9X6U770_BACCE|nr:MULTISPECIES: hypothetical protein [Bacillus]EEL19777.1 hypothetical protein bcere0017_54500 [Bacillus cereus Rock1-3]MDH8705423.1 hypothetical protein [Stenotrophomonas sp. 1198]PEZ63289.1 hypothetical protein CN372_13815 [Bacillus anthracis]KAA0742970.1 hypothetical protein DN397_28230 [Bacillus sp. AY1-10]KAB2357008.1 hypothetical protein F8503_23025 [Bacillus toyonensis]